MLLRSRAAKERRTCGSCKPLPGCQQVDCTANQLRFDIPKKLKLTPQYGEFHQNPDKRKTSPKTTLHRTFQLSQITPSPKKIPRPYYPSDRASDLLLPFRWCFTSARKLRKNTKNPTKSKAFQCPESNAIIDPGTMVIHLQNTGLTWAAPRNGAGYLIS